MQRQQKTIKLIKPTSIKKPVKEITEEQKNNIYELFKNEDFLTQAAFIVRDFLIVTWQMDSENYIEILREKILIAKFCKLVEASLVNPSMATQQISSVVNKILTCFLDANENNALYEAIFLKWKTLRQCGQDEAVIQSDFVDKKNLLWNEINLYLMDLRSVIKHGIAEITGLNSSTQEFLTELNFKNKLKVLARLTNNEISEDAITINDHRPILAMQIISLIFISMGSAFLFGLSTNTLGFLIFLSVLLPVFGYDILTSTSHIAACREMAPENIRLTDYFIIDKLVHSVKNLVNPPSNPEPIVEQAINKPKKSTSHPKTIPMRSNELSPIAMHLDLPKDKHPVNDAHHAGNRSPRSKRIWKQKLCEELHDKNEIRTKKMLETFNVQSIAFGDHVYNPLELDDKKKTVIELWSANGYLKQHCKNQFILFDKPTMKKDIKDKVFYSRMKHIIRDGAVVSSINHNGIVLENNSYKGKIIGKDTSHKRYHYTPTLWTTVKEQEQQIIKTLHTSTGLTNI